MLRLPTHCFTVDFCAGLWIEGSGVIHTPRPPGWDAAAAEGTKFRSITDSSTSRTDVFSSARRRAVGGGDGRDPHAAQRPHVLPAAAALHAARHAAPAAALPLRRARRSLRDCNPRNGRMNVWNGDLTGGCAHTSIHAGNLPCSCTVLSAPPQLMVPWPRQLKTCRVLVGIAPATTSLWKIRDS